MGPGDSVAYYSPYFIYSVNQNFEVERLCKLPSHKFISISAFKEPIMQLHSSNHISFGTSGPKITLTSSQAELKTDHFWANSIKIGNMATENLSYKQM